MRGPYLRDEKGRILAQRLPQETIDLFIRMGAAIVSWRCREYGIPLHLAIAKKHQTILMPFRGMLADEISRLHINGIKIPCKYVLAVINRPGYGTKSDIKHAARRDHMPGIKKLQEIVRLGGHRHHKRKNKRKTNYSMAKELGEPYFGFYKFYISKGEPSGEALRMAREDKAKDERRKAA